MSAVTAGLVPKSLQSRTSEEGGDCPPAVTRGRQGMNGVGRAAWRGRVQS